MKFKERIKSAGFWTGIVGAVFLILGAFGVEIGDQTASSVVSAISSLLVLTGIVSSPSAATEEDADGELGERNDNDDE